MKNALVLILLTFTGRLLAQSIVINGRVLDAATNEGVAGAEVKVLKTSVQSVSDSLGNFSLTLTSAGFYVVEANAVSYNLGYSAEMLYTFDKSPFTEILLDPIAKKIKGATIVRSTLQKRNAESPVSALQLSIREIERNPGGNRDISKIVQSLPGVISIPGFRNDIIIRGGAPVENKFYLDGIEIPIINHFQTQGSTGGPVGVLNVNFIKDVNFYTGAFPVNLANGTSAVVDFRQMEGNRDKPKFRFTLGSSDLGFTADGPIGKKSTFIASARQSYLQGLFSLLKLPFLPNFIDYQAKYNYKIDSRRSFTVIGLGAIDFFKLNEKVNEGVTDSLQLKSNRYILGNIPEYSQRNYTIGAFYTQFSGRSKNQYFISRSYLNNATVKYENNDHSRPELKILDYRSTEAENKFRYEHSNKYQAWSVLGGAGTEFSEYFVNAFNRVATPAGPLVFQNESRLRVWKYSTFFRASRTVFNSTLISAGIRFDGNNYNASMANLFLNPAFSLSASFPVLNNLYWNVNVGQFRQLPSYSILGYRDSNGSLANKNRLKYVVCRQWVSGLQYNVGNETKVTVEGFYKMYSRYPFNIADSISLGNLGADFAAIGNSPITSNGKGKSYGIEFLAQRRSKSGLYGILSYTLVWSFFEDKTGKMVASAWDSRHTIVATGGYKLKRNWEIGGKWRLVTGRPYTPVNVQASLLKQNWDVSGQAIPNFNLLNTGRLSNFTQFDIRVDKVWYFKRSSLNLYIDIQNLLNSQYVGPNTLIAAQNADGSLATDPNNPNAYKADYLPNSTGTVLPTIGVIFDF